MQVICTARVTTAHGFRAFRADALSMTSNASEATSQGSSPYSRASRRYLWAVYRISSAASRSPRQESGPASCSRISSARKPTGVPKPWRAEPAWAAGSLAAGEVCLVTVAPPVKEVRHQHPSRDARQHAATSAARQQGRSRE